MHVRTCRKFSKIKVGKKFTFCKSGPVKNVNNGSWLKIHILQVRTCQKCQKWKLAKNPHFCCSGTVKSVKNGSWLRIYIFARRDPSKMSIMKCGQNFTFLQVRTCQNFQKWKLAKNSHFSCSAPVKNVKNENWPKFHIFAGPDLSIMSKMEVG